MANTQSQTSRRPRVAVTLGDQAGVGPELIAKLLSNYDNLEKADILLMCDKEEYDAARADAGGVEASNVVAPQRVRIMHDGTMPKDSMARAEVHQQNGERCIHQLQRCLALARSREIDAIVFGPLNKSSLKKAGMTEEDELRWFAKQLNFTGTTSEINIAGPLWTARVTSHVGVEKVAKMVTKESTLKAIELLNRLR